MRFSAVASLILSLVLLANVPSAFPMETDQYNLPPVPLYDIGDEVSDHVAENLVTAVAKINAEIAVHQACLNLPPAKDSKCGSVETESARLAYLRSNDAVAKEVFKLLGDGNLFITKTGRWFQTHEFSHKPVRYKTDYLESIYATLPSDYLTMSPTVRLYGTEFGTDKIEHFLQQGYGYYKIYRKETVAGATPENAAAKAVKWGRMTEKTYFGLLVAGVYSNADLVANYAGMKFYLGLTQPVKIGTVTKPAILELKNGAWAIADNAALRENLIKPFLSDHLNEALNPSVYAFNLYPFVRSVVKKKSCPQWKKMYPDLTRNSLETRTAALTIWNGEDYGHLTQSRMVSLAETCFAAEKDQAE